MKLRVLILSSLFIACASLPNSFSAGGVQGNLEIKMGDNVPLTASYEVWDDVQKLNTTNVRTTDLNALISDSYIRFSKPGNYTVFVEIDGIKTVKEVTVGSLELLLDLPITEFEIEYQDGSVMQNTSRRVLLNGVKSIYGAHDDSRALLLTVDKDGSLNVQDGLELSGSVLSLQGGEN